MRKLLYILIFIPFGSYAQTGITLDSCYKWARNNYPNLRQSGYLEQISRLKMENIETSWLPSVVLNGQATYQSDVTGIKIPLPTISIPTVSKDQYKVYAEFRQTIWDGGLSKASGRLEEAILKSNLNQLEVEIYKLNEQVSSAYFAALLAGSQVDIIREQLKSIQESRKSLESGFMNGVVEKSSLLAIDAEILAIRQNEIQAKTIRSSSLAVLSFLTGKVFNDEIKLALVQKDSNVSNTSQRPELALFSSQRNQLRTQSDLLRKSRLPKIAGFGQLGYGRPGLNMLNNNFDSYYFVGLGISWNALDWKKTLRQQQILDLQDKSIMRQEETFMQSLNILGSQQREQIRKIESFAVSDNEIIRLRNEITKVSESKLRNGAVTTADYIRDLQAETVAKLNAELHRIQLIEAKERFLIINGAINSK